MYELKKIGKVLTSKSVGTGPSSCEKRIYRAAVSRRSRNAGLELGRIGETTTAHLVAESLCLYGIDDGCQ